MVTDQELVWLVADAFTELYRHRARPYASKGWGETAFYLAGRTEALVLVLTGKTNATEEEVFAILKLIEPKLVKFDSEPGAPGRDGGDN